MLKQIVKEPTRVTKESKTLIDHIYITNLEKLVVQYSVSDHYPVCMTRSEQISVKTKIHGPSIDDTKFLFIWLSVFRGED
jgi:hypothetical protein